jgi:hypothetical protein
MKEANTLAYYDMATITAVKSFSEQASAGARKLTGENLKLVWAEFSTISWAVFEDVHETHVCGHTPTSIVENSAQVLSCQLKFVHDLVKLASFNQIGAVTFAQSDEMSDWYQCHDYPASSVCLSES